VNATVGLVWAYRLGWSGCTDGAILALHLAQRASPGNTRFRQDPVTRLHNLPAPERSLRAHVGGQQYGDEISGLNTRIRPGAVLGERPVWRSQEKIDQPPMIDQTPVDHVFWISVCSDI